MNSVNTIHNIRVVMAFALLQGADVPVDARAMGALVGEVAVYALRISLGIAHEPVTRQVISE
jgi:hypothetical protein